MKKTSFGLTGKIAGFASAVIAGVVGNLVFDYALHRDFLHPFRAERPALPATAAVKIPAMPAASHDTTAGLVAPKPSPPSLALTSGPVKPPPSSLPIVVDTPPAPPVAAARPAPPPQAASSATPFIADLPQVRLRERPPPPPHPGPGNGGLY